MPTREALSSRFRILGSRRETRAVMAVMLFAALLTPETSPAQQSATGSSPGPNAANQQEYLQPPALGPHHQPTQQELLDRERQRNAGKSDMANSTADDHATDELYQDVMRRSAPPTGQHP